MTTKENGMNKQAAANNRRIRQKPVISFGWGAGALIALLLALSHARAQSGGGGSPTVSPDSGDVFLMTDESVLLSAGSEPDPGSPPTDMDCGCDSAGNSISPESTITAVWSGDVIDPEDPDKVRLDTSTEGDKTVTVTYYVKWLCPDATDPDAEDPGTEIDSATANYNVVTPKVIKVGFLDGHVLKKWADKSDIANPVWEKPLTGAITKNEAAAYTKGGKAKAELFIEAEETLTHSTSVEVRGRGVGTNDENFDSQSATFHNWTWNSGELVLNSSELYQSVNTYDSLEVKWQFHVSKPGGGWSAWTDMNETQHKIFVTYATPRESPTYDEALARACVYAANKQEVPEIATKVAFGIDEQIDYDIEVEGIADQPLGEYTAGGTVCKGNAILMAYLTRSLGMVLLGKWWENELRRTELMGATRPQSPRC